MEFTTLVVSQFLDDQRSGLVFQVASNEAEAQSTRFVNFDTVNRSIGAFDESSSVFGVGIAQLVPRNVFDSTTEAPTVASPVPRSNGLSTAALVVIAAACLLFLLLCVLVSIACRHRRGRYKVAGKASGLLPTVAADQPTTAGREDAVAKLHKQSTYAIAVLGATSKPPLNRKKTQVEGLLPQGDISPLSYQCFPREHCMSSPEDVPKLAFRLRGSPTGLGSNATSDLVEPLSPPSYTAQHSVVSPDMLPSLLKGGTLGSGGGVARAWAADPATVSSPSTSLHLVQPIGERRNRSLDPLPAQERKPGTHVSTPIPARALAWFDEPIAQSATGRPPASPAISGLAPQLKGLPELSPLGGMQAEADGSPQLRSLPPRRPTTHTVGQAPRSLLWSPESLPPGGYAEAGQFPVYTPARAVLPGTPVRDLSPYASASDHQRLQAMREKRLRVADQQQAIVQMRRHRSQQARVAPKGSAVFPPRFDARAAEGPAEEV